MIVFTVIGIGFVAGLALLGIWLLVSLCFGKVEITLTGGDREVRYQRGRWPWQWHRTYEDEK